MQSQLVSSFRFNVHVGYNRPAHILDRTVEIVPLTHSDNRTIAQCGKPRRDPPNKVLMGVTDAAFDAFFKPRAPFIGIGSEQCDGIESI